MKRKINEALEALQYEEKEYIEPEDGEEEERIVPEDDYILD